MQKISTTLLGFDPRDTVVAATWPAPGGGLTSLKVEEAKRLLEVTSLPIDVIARLAGSKPAPVR